MQIGLLLLWLYISVLCHELGHLLAAQCAGLKPYKIEIGSGPQVWCGTIGNIFCNFKLFPGHGLAHARYQTLQHLRWRLALFTAGGPLTHLILACLVIWLGQTFQNASIGCLFYLEVFLFVCNIYPDHLTIGKERIPSDGLKLWRLLMTNNIELSIRDYQLTVESQLKRYAVNAIDRKPFDGDIESCLTLANAELARSENSYDQTIDLFATLLDSRFSSDLEKLYLIDSLCCIVLYHGQRKFLNQADRWSQQAMQIAPTIKTIHGTRGGILVELGDYGAGKTLLLPLTEPDNDPIDRAVSCFYLAKIETALGNQERAQEWSKKAAETDMLRNLGIQFNSDSEQSSQHIG